MELTILVHKCLYIYTYMYIYDFLHIYIIVFQLNLNWIVHFRKVQTLYETFNV